MTLDTSPERPHVLVIDDEEDLCELLTLRLEHHGFRVSSEQTVRGGVEVLEREIVDALIVDLRLEGENGLVLLEEVAKRSLDLPVIILTAHGTIETAVDAMKRGAYGFLTKPFDDHELLQKLNHAVERNRLSRELAGLRRIVGAPSSARLLGTSARLNAIREVIARVAATDANVLVLGESGTGKEVAARSIHELSNRRQAAFVAINCGALPGDLLESELFGYVKGAFTGATRNKEGLFAAAEGGTLFLDEIGDAPANVQVKLLRVLQERTYLPVGATESHAADVRIVAATNRDLRADVAAGRFREDLFYRLHVVPITMPPLRERREDIPLLIDHFVARNNVRLGTEIRGLDSEARRLLYEYSWPGNVRELENTVERAMVLAEGDQITTADLSERVREARDPVKLQLSSGELSVKKTTRYIEEVLIRRALQKTKGNRTRAAELLEISHRALLYKIKDYGITDL